MKACVVSAKAELFRVRITDPAGVQHSYSVGPRAEVEEEASTFQIAVKRALERVASEYEDVWQLGDTLEVRISVTKDRR